MHRDRYFAQACVVLGLLTILAALPLDSGQIFHLANGHSNQNNISITSRPEFFNPSVNSTLAGNATQFRLQWTDSTGLSRYIFSYDSGSGSFVNDSSAPFSGSVNWSNITQTTPSVVGEKIRWKVYAYDASGNSNSSLTYCFVAGSANRISTLSSYVTITDDCYDILLYDGSTIENIANSPQFVQTNSSFVGYHEIRWNPQMTLALADGYNNTLMSFDGNIVTPLRTGLPPSTDLISISWKPDGTSALITGSSGNTGYLLQYSNGAVTIVNVSRISWNRVAWNPHGDYALIIGGSGTIARYPSPGTFSKIESNTTANLSGIDFAPNGTRALIAGESGVLLEYFGSNSSVRALPSLTNPAPQYIRFNRSGSYALLTAQNNGIDDLFAWNGSGRATAVSTPITNTANEIAFAPNDSYALVTTTQGSLLKVDYESSASTLLSIAGTKLRGIDWFVVGGITTTTSSTVASLTTTQTVTSSSSPSLIQSDCCTTVTSVSSAPTSSSSTIGTTQESSLLSQWLALGIVVVVAISLIGLAARRRS